MALTSNRASQRRLGAGGRVCIDLQALSVAGFYASVCRGRYRQWRSAVRHHCCRRAGGADAQNRGVVTLSVQSHSVKSAESASAGSVVQQHIAGQLKTGFTGGFQFSHLCLVLTKGALHNNVFGDWCGVSMLPLAKQ